MTSDLRTQALHVAGAIDPDLMTGSEAAAALDDLAVADKAVTGTLLFLALRVARTGGWRGQGHASPADWLASRIGVSVAEAKRQLGTAEKAEDLPKTKEAIKNGDLSASQAGAVTDGAAADPAAEDDLLASAARDTNKDLREKAAKARAAATSSEERERRIHRNRSLRRGTDAEGAAWGHFSGPGAASALLEQLLRPYEELVFRQHRAAGVRSTYENRAFDALLALLAHHRHLLHGGTSPAPAPHRGTESAAGPDPGAATGVGRPAPAPPPAPGPPAPAPDATGPEPPGSPPVWTPPWDPDHPLGLPARVPGGNNVKVIVIVDHAALLRGHTTAGETCEIAGVGPVSVDAVRAILRDDPFLAVVVRKGQDIVSVAHHGRGLNAAQRTAIEADGVRCTNVACNRTVAIQIDHRVPYATDPITELANADPLCTPCHQLKTHHGHALEPGSGRRRFLAPDAPRPEPPPATRRPLPRYDPALDPLPSGPELAALMDERELTDEEMGWLEARVRHRLAARRDARAASSQAGRIEQPTLC